MKTQATYPIHEGWGPETCETYLIYKGHKNVCDKTEMEVFFREEELIVTRWWNTEDKSGQFVGFDVNGYLVST